MNIIKLIFLSFLFVITLTACEDDDDQKGMTDINNADIRVKRIIGENTFWGEYELEFNYRSDGRLDTVWRFSRDENLTVQDTLGKFTVEYNMDYHKFEIYDMVMNIDVDSVKILQDLYPDTYKDTLRNRRVPRLFYRTTLEDNHFVTNAYRPRHETGAGKRFNSAYLNVSSLTQIAEIGPEGNPVVVRCNEDVYGIGGDNNNYSRTVYKYEFTYAENVIVSGVWSKPDSHSDTSWSKLDEYTCSNYKGFLTSMDSDHYKMRRSGNKIVIAEPGKNTTYILNSEGLASKMETTDGDTASIEYEDGWGNFSELYATPLERALGKVWVK